MKRWALRILVFLLLGAIVNVAVAWMLLLYAPAVTQQPVGRYHPPANGSQWGLDVIRYDSAFAVRTIANARGRGSMLPPSPKQIEIFPRWTHWSSELDTISSNAATAFASGATGDPLRPIIGTQMFEACGWPMHAVQARWDGRDASVDHTKRWRCGISRISAVPMSPSTNAVLLNDLHVLPYEPMWPGFVVNTLFYAAMLCGVCLSFAVPIALRRRRRIKRGLCAKCGYNLQGVPSTSDVCPECGASMR